MASIFQTTFLMIDTGKRRAISVDPEEQERSTQETELNGGIGSTDTSITLNVAFTRGGYTFNDTILLLIPGFMIIEDEIIGFTGVTASGLTGVTRGLFGTTAISHTDGTSIEEALQLDITEFRMSLGGMLQDQPTAIKYEADDQTGIWGLSEVDQTGTGIPSWTIRGTNDFTRTSGLERFSKIIQSTRTKGLKLIRGADKSKAFLNYINFFDDSYADVSKSRKVVIDGILVRIKLFELNPKASSSHSTWGLTLAETS